MNHLQQRPGLFARMTGMQLPAQQPRLQLMPYTPYTPLPTAQPRPPHQFAAAPQAQSQFPQAPRAQIQRLPPPQPNGPRHQVVVDQLWSYRPFWEMTTIQTLQNGRPVQGTNQYLCQAYPELRQKLFAMCQQALSGNPVDGTAAPAPVPARDEEVILDAGQIDNKDEDADYDPNAEKKKNGKKRGRPPKASKCLIRQPAGARYSRNLLAPGPAADLTHSVLDGTRTEPLTIDEVSNNGVKGTNSENDFFPNDVLRKMLYRIVNYDIMPELMLMDDESKAEIVERWSEMRGLDVEDVRIGRLWRRDLVAKIVEFSEDVVRVKTNAREVRGEVEEEGEEDQEGTAVESEDADGADAAGVQDGQIRLRLRGSL